MTWTPELTELVAKAYERGVPATEIATIFGKSPDGIRQKMHKLGVVSGIAPTRYTRAFRAQVVADARSETCLAAALKWDVSLTNVHRWVRGRR